MYLYMLDVLELGLICLPLRRLLYQSSHDIAKIICEFIRGCYKVVNSTREIFFISLFCCVVCTDV